MDNLTKTQRRKNMQAIRSFGTKAEVKLASALWNLGYRYRKNDKTVFGKPDLTFKRIKLVIFVNGEYFHGRDWEKNKFRINTNREFWWKKIEGNIERDKLVVSRLSAEGWKVLSFWDTDILKNVEYCINMVQETILELKNAKKILRNPKGV